MGLFTVDLDCSALARAGLREVDMLARLCLELRRHRCELRLRNVDDDLARLIGFAGLADVLGVEARGQAEKREEPGRVQEERELGDQPS